jgi:hypothetical protein
LRKPCWGYLKRVFEEDVVHGNQSTVNPKRTRAKAGAPYKLTLPAGGSASARLRLALMGSGSKSAHQPFGDFDNTLAARLREAHASCEEFQADKAPTRPRYGR